MATALRASHVRFANILESCCCLHGYSCRACRHIYPAVSKPKRARSLDSTFKTSIYRYRHSNGHDKGMGDTVHGASTVQNADQWSRLKGTVSGIKATVSKMSQSLKSTETVIKETSRVTSAGDPQIDDLRALKTELVSTPREDTEDVDSVASKDMADEKQEKVESVQVANQHLYIRGDEEKEQNAKWVQQILDIQDKHDRQVFDKLAHQKKLNLAATDIEKLDDPMSQTYTELPKVQNNSYFLVNDLYNKITFSYFSKSQPQDLPVKETEQTSQVSGETSQLIQQDINQSGQTTTSSGMATSTINRIREAVTFSSRQNKNNSTIAAAPKKEKSQAADAKPGEVVVQKPSKPPDADRSYWNMLSNLQQSILLNLSLTSSPTQKSPSEMQEHIARNIMHSELESESAFAQRTCSLSDNLVSAESTMSKLKRLDELCLHLIQHPQFRHIAVKHKVLPCLLEMCESGHPKLISRANEALALIGYHRPPKGRGIRMISVDGGGTRGLIAIETLMRLEKLSGQPVNQMFDFVIGSSTGALLAALIFLMKIPLEQCKELYLDRSAKMFVKESLLSKTKNMALHDVSIFEEVVRAEVGEATLSSFSRDPTAPRMAITSTLSNVPKWKTFLFRNYNHRPGAISDYRGTCNLKIWQAIRASGSAPIYYSPFQIGEHIFRDGGCLANNPTAVGLHESKLLWPHESFQCILSLGNGKYDPGLYRMNKEGGYNVIPRSMKDLADGIIDSATDTEEVHFILKNTLDPAIYFRFSPYLKENYPLSEVNPDRIRAMLSEATQYMDKNELFMQKLVAKLKLDRLPNQKLMDFTYRRKETHNYFVF